MARQRGVEETRENFVKALTRAGTDPDEIERFIKRLHLALNVCTTRNIENCTSFILQHVLASSKCTVALARLLLAISISFPPRALNRKVDTTKPEDENAGLGKIVKGRVQQPPMPHFKRLHVLYVMSDVWMTVQRHVEANERTDAAADDLSHNAALLKRWIPLHEPLAALTGSEDNAKSYQDLEILMSLWRDQQLVSEAELADLHGKALRHDRKASSWEDLVAIVAAEEAAIIEAITREEEDASLRVPARHGLPGDPNPPWHELPAANGLYMKRTRGYPLRVAAMPVGGYELDTEERVPEPELKLDVQNLHKDMLRCYDKYTNPADVQDIDPLGNIIYNDPDRPTRNYWGWSLDGVEKRKEMAQQFRESATGYADLPRPTPNSQLNSAVARARSLAAERGYAGRGRGYGRGRGGGGGGPPLPPPPPPPPSRGRGPAYMGHIGGARY